MSRILEVIPQQLKNSKNQIRNTRHNYDIDELRKYMNQRMEQSFQWLSKKSDTDSEDQNIDEIEAGDIEDIEKCSSSSGGSIMRRTFRFVRSFFQTPDSDPGPQNCQMRSSGFWRLPTEQDARNRLSKIESDFLETTTRINKKMIGEDCIPFSVHISSEKWDE